MTAPFGRILLGGSLAALLALAGCYTVPETGRKSLVIVPPEQEAALGAQAFQEVRAQEKVSKDPAANERVTRVGRRIASVVGQDLPGAQWEFVVFDSPEVNAFALPGGKVGVYTGLLKLATTDDELAIVMGHEIGHVTARHGAERMTLDQGVQLLGGVVGAAADTKLSTNTSNLVKLAYGAGSQVLGVLPHSRFQESEADKIGLRYAAKAGYDPRAAIEFWRKMNQQGSASAGPTFLRTHPSGEDRIAQLQAELPEVLPLYQAARSGAPAGARPIGSPIGRPIGSPP